MGSERVFLGMAPCLSVGEWRASGAKERLQKPKADQYGLAAGLPAAGSHQAIAEQDTLVVQSSTAGQHESKAGDDPPD